MAVVRVTTFISRIFWTQVSTSYSSPCIPSHLALTIPSILRWIQCGQYMLVCQDNECSSAAVYCQNARCRRYTLYPMDVRISSRWFQKWAELEFNSTAQRTCQARDYATNPNSRCGFNHLTYKNDVSTLKQQQHPTKNPCSSRNKLPSL